MAYSGKYRPKNPEKYIGDVKDIVYRSLWERSTFKWIDHNSSIVRWNSEDCVIPYICGTDNKQHKYYLDLWFQTDEGKTYIVEIKPKAQTQQPKKPQRQTRRYITESLTWVKNQSKWKAAEEYAADRGWHFEIWTEDTLRSLGIRLVDNKPPGSKPTRRRKSNTTSRTK